jgi:TolB-like protein/class 3 adenylate cyclase
MTEQRRLAAIVSADVAGYSRLMGLDESGTLAALKALRREVFDPAIAIHGGRIVKTTGDGLLLEFPSVVNAVRCAVEVQTAMGDRTAEVADDRRIAFRIGINQGDIIIDGDDIFGDGVNVAARLQEIAPAGGICISSRVHDDVRDRLDITFDDGGTQTLKNIARPVQVWRWQPGRPVAPKSPPAPTALALPDKPSIAVLPFQNMSGDPEQEYFADGIVEDLVTALSRFQQFFVIARNSSFTYKGRAVDVRQVGRELGVRYVLEGSVRKAGSRVRITGQLIDSLSGAHLWADRFDGPLEDVFDLQDRITGAVAGVLPITIQQAEIDRVTARKTSSPGAYDRYLLGMKNFYASARPALDAALNHFYRAIELDAEFVEPHAWASILYTRRKQAQWMGDMRAECEEGVRLGRRAVELRPDNPLALGAAGFALAYLAGETAAGLDFIDRSLALNRNDALTWHGSGWARCYNGDYDVAIEHIERAERLSPVDPQGWQFHLAKCLGHFGAGRYEMAVGLARTVTQRHPNEPAGYIHLARSAALAGQLEEARRAMARALELNPALSLRRDALVPVMRQNEDRDRLIKAYRLAGMPE